MTEPQIVPEPGAAADQDAGGLLTKRKMLVGVVGLLVVVTVMSLFADARDLAKHLADFSWWLMPLVIIGTVWNYAFRYGKWSIYLDALEIPRIPHKTNVLIYLSGFGMSLTPGKVGELIKAIYVRRVTGVPANRTSAAIAAERLTDGIAMLLIATIGLVQFDYARPLLVVFLVLAAGAVLLFQRPALLERVLLPFERFAVVARGAVHLKVFLHASGRLFQADMLTRAVVIGVISWIGECLAFYLVLIGLGFGHSLNLALIATFAMVVSSILGGASMLPGGLGVADASFAGMLLLLVKDPLMDKSVAVAATLLIRFATLWFATIIGLVAIAMLERRSKHGLLPYVGPPLLGLEPVD